MYIPYVYLVKNKTTGLKYIGVKHQKNCRPELFWVTYFTSSNAVKNLIKLYGKEDFVFRIIKTFENHYDAIKFESELLKIATKRDDYLNMHAGYLGDLNEEELLENERQQKIRASIQGKLSYKNKTGLHSLTKEEKSAISRESGKKAGIINKALGRAIFDPEVRKRQHETLKEKQVSAYYDPKLRAGICLKGGEASVFGKSYCEKHGISEEERIEAQRDRGRRGGPKNKGFKWYNDGDKYLKYTTSMQEELSFEEFLTQNTNFKAGKGIGTGSVTGKILVTDGVKNFYIFPDQFNKDIHTKVDRRKKKDEN
jgi:hypothetical protein